MFTRTPFNEAEAIVAPLWDDAISPRAQCEIWTNPAPGAKVYQNWCWLGIEWAKAAAAGPLARICCRPDLRLFDEDELMIYGGLLRGTALTVRIRADGQEQTPIANVEGADMEDEWAGPIAGRRLQELVIEIQALKTIPPGTVSLMWIGVANRQAKARMLAQRKTYSPDWPEHLLPAAAIENPRPQLGLLFGPEDLPALRAKAATPLYRPLMERLRREAADAARGHPPEQFVGPYLVRGFGKGADNFKRPGDDRWTPVAAARTCAFVGLLDEDREMLRYAARCALAMSHCATWVGGVMENLTGSRWHQRSFLDAIYARSCLRVWDWAGSALTNEGQAFLRHAIVTKALGRIQQDAWEYEYIHHCNQGPLFFAAWLAALIACGREWPRARDLLPIVERYQCEALGSYIAEDGGAGEGPGYVINTLIQLEGLYMLARERGQEFGKYLRGVMPARFFRITDYCRAMMASPAAGRPMGYLTIGDSGHGGLKNFSADAALMLYLATGDPLWETVFAEAMATPEALLDTPFWMGPAALLALGPEQPRRNNLRPPIFARLPVVGQLTSCRATPFGLVRFHLCGKMAQTDHSHEDCGSFILEAGGEELAIDRGILTYSDPRHNRQGYPSQHNLLLPLLPDNREPRQLLGGPMASVPEGAGDERALKARIDTTAAWNGLFRQNVRQVDSPEPERFIITDEAEFDEPRAVSFNLHTRLPIVAAGPGEWIVQGERVTLRVRPQWQVAEARIFTDGVDGAGTAVNRLCLIAPPAAKHALATELHIREKAR